MYGTVATEFDRLFREVRCPVPQKIGSFLHQAESLGLSFKFETMARPDEFAGPLFDTQVTQHLEGKGFAFSCPLGMSNVETMSRYTWSFLMTGKSQRSAFGAKLSSSRKSAEDVTHKDLANNAEKLPAPSPLHDHRLVFICAFVLIFYIISIDAASSATAVYHYWSAPGTRNASVPSPEVMEQTFPS